MTRWALYSPLEHDTASKFIDEFAEVPVDASQVIWVATANDAHAIPEPILNRVNVYEVSAPDSSRGRGAIARWLHQSCATVTIGAVALTPTRPMPCLTISGRAGAARDAPRFDDGLYNARLVKRETLLTDDLPHQRQARARSASCSEVHPERPALQCRIQASSASTDIGLPMP